MSLLRDVLKKKKDGAASKRDSASVKSAGARSLVASLYSLTIGGQRVKKRRRPDFSTLGAPEWYYEDPPEPSDMPGTAPRTDLGAYTIAHGTVLPLRIDEKSHWLSLILFNHATDASLAAMYHNEAQVAGEVRLCLDKTKNISSIDVWLTAIAPSGQIISLTANVWNRQKGNPLRTDPNPRQYKGKFPQGTYVFPFELPPLPKFVPVTHPDNDTRKTKGLVPLPPSGKINYTCGVGVRRDSVAGINEDMDMILQYIPLVRPLPRRPTPFPFLASREDWPFKRETIGGWVLSPFGGRGRIGAEVVEIEGIVRCSVHCVLFAPTEWTICIARCAGPGGIHGRTGVDIRAIAVVNECPSTEDTWTTCGGQRRILQGGFLALIGGAATPGAVAANAHTRTYWRRASLGRGCRASEGGRPVT
ncbi:hypothetical protein C8R43DRAFT_344142 [Mycena crocata]|nr:hypothetical protein C8R43DRAFT_344142 [Mycena crocata]